MKILNIVKAVTFYIDTDNKDYGLFRRGENGEWEQLMGESWESCYFLETELEAAFQAFIRSNQDVVTATEALDGSISHVDYYTSS